MFNETSRDKGSQKIKQTGEKYYINILQLFTFILKIWLILLQTTIHWKTQQNYKIVLHIRFDKVDIK